MAMPGPDLFRRKLARRLIAIAVGRTRACAGHPSGDDLKVMAQCHDLARSAADLDARSCAEVAALQGDPACARRFADLWRDLPEALGVTVWPRSAGELVNWMVRQADHPPSLSRRERLANGAPPREPATQGRSAPGSLAAAMAADFTGALAVAAPVLAFWEVSVGMGQWKAGAFATTHAAADATVLSVDPATGDRGVPTAGTATIVFAPSPGASACRVRVELRGASVEPGATLRVLPRSDACEPPLVPTAAGDPIASFTLAAAFLAAGLASGMAWTRLSRPGRPSDKARGAVGAIARVLAPPLLPHLR